MTLKETWNHHWRKVNWPPIGFGKPHLLKHFGSQYLGIFVFTCAALFFAFLLFDGIRSNEILKFRRAFNDASLERVVAIESAMTRYENSLRALASLYNATGSVSRDTFDIFASALIKRNPGIQALEWVPRVGADELALYEEDARQWYPYYRVVELDLDSNTTQVKQRSEYYPVYYVVPYAGNERALGFDLGSNHTRKAALDHAASTGELVASSRLRLIQERGQQFGILLIIPVYTPHERTETQAERKENLEGYVLGVFRVGDIVNKALAHMTATNIGVIVKDISAPKAEQFLHYFSPTGFTTAPDDFPLSYSRTFRVNGRVWAVLCISEPGYSVEGAQWIAWSALLSSMVIIFLIAGYLISLVTRNEKISAVVDERTEALRKESKTVHALNDRLTEKAITFRKFVPEQFLEMLDLDTEESIVIGEGKDLNLTISFADIRNFTRLSETQDAKKVFQLINSYLACTGPIVNSNNGFIDHFIGDGVVMIFYKADEAVRSAVELQHYVQTHPMRLSEEAGDQVYIDIGIGIHSGLVIAGTVGTDVRMQTTVIGDTVNGAARLEALNKNYGTKLLISCEVRDALDSPSEFITRPVGDMQMRGKELSTGIYEVVSALPAEQCIKICAILELYSSALEQFRQLNYIEARRMLEECLKIHPKDGVCRHFLNMIEHGLASSSRRDRQPAHR